MKWPLLTLACLALLGIGPGRAEEPTPADQEIVVTGDRDRREPVRAFVDSITVKTEGQVARFETPVCPAAFGLPQGHNEVVAERVRLVAEHLGIPTGGRGCRANLVVIITDEGERFFHALRHARPSLFADLALAEVRRMLQLDGPSRVWHLVEPRGADGRPLEPIGFLQTSPNAPPRYIAHGRQLHGVVASLTSRATRQDLSLAFVVLDLKALDGLTLIQIADHAAMRALARTDPAALPSGSSILSLFADSTAGFAPAEELTGWDIAYLRALYRGANIVAANQQRGEIARAMRAELASEAP